MDEKAPGDDLRGRWQQSRRQGQAGPDEDGNLEGRELPEDRKRQQQAVAAVEAFLQLSQEMGATTAPRAGGAETAAPPGPVAPFPAAVPEGPLPGYAFLGELGRGGMGVVWKARDLTLKRVVALKMILARGFADPEQRDRFRAEAEAVARLQHPHVVQIYASGEHEGLPWFAMEFIDGVSLDQKLQGQPQPPRDAARLVLLLARAAHAAHRQGIVHRDLKPHNVLLAPPADEPALNSAYGWPKLTDFGLAKHLDAAHGPTASGAILGTASYMAPEQATGKTKEVGPATDVYALGAILYELLAGRPPFKGESFLDTLELVRTAPPPPPHTLRADVPAELEAICLKCLAKAPADRYTTVAALAEDLQRFLGDQPVRAEPTARPSRLRQRWLLAATAAVLVVGAVLLLRPWDRSGEAPVAGSGDSGSMTPAVASSAAKPQPLAPLSGYVDVLVYDPNNPRRQNVRLNDREAVPVNPGDEFCIEAELNRPAYLYVLWIGTDGSVYPIYPWEPSKWESYPTNQQPVRKLRRPEPVDEFYRIETGTPGMETIVMFAREEPLPSNLDQKLRAELTGLPPQQGQDLRATAWFENGELVRHELGRNPRFDAKRRDDPVLVAQQRIRALQQRHFSYSRAVSFASQGQ
jgi:serine/threonine protein kinase